MPVFTVTLSKGPRQKKSKLDHRLVTLGKAHYNAAASNGSAPANGGPRAWALEILPHAGYTSAPLAMNNVMGVGQRLVARVVLLQSGCAAFAGLLFWGFADAAAARAGLAGGLVVAVGSALFGWRMFAPGVASAAILHRALFAAESLKWCWVVLAVWVAFSRWRLAPLPFMTGLVGAQFGYWLGLVGSKRGKMEKGKVNGSV